MREINPSAKLHMPQQSESSNFNHHVAGEKKEEVDDEIATQQESKVWLEEGSATTPIYIAAQNGQVEVIKMLASRGADINADNGVGASPVCVAAGNGHVDVIETLAELGADLHKPTHNGTTPLYVAAHEGQGGAVRALVKLGADPNEPNSHGITPLYIAAQEGHESVIRALADVGANFEQDAYCYAEDAPAPVMYIASQEGHARVICTLVILGCDVNIRRFDGTSPIHVASAANHLEVINVLYELGADVHAMMNNGATPLHIAAQEGHTEVIKLLVTLGANIDATDDKGRAPAHIASKMGHVDALNAIIDIKGNVEAIQSSTGHSPLMTTAICNHRNAFHTLVGAGVDIRQFYVSQDMEFSTFSGEIRSMVNDHNWSTFPSVSAIEHERKKNDDVVDALVMMHNQHNMSSASCQMCCIFSLSNLMATPCHSSLLGSKIETLGIIESAHCNNKCYNLDEKASDEPSLEKSLQLLVKEHSMANLQCLRNADIIVRMQNVSYVHRRLLVRLAWKTVETAIAPPSGKEFISRYIDLVFLLLDEDVLCDVVSLRLTCKSNSERRRFPVVSSRGYEELETNLVEEWLVYGSSSSLMTTSMLHTALAMHRDV